MVPVPSPSDVTAVSRRVSRYAVKSYHWMIAVLRAHAVVRELLLYRRWSQGDKVYRINALLSFISSDSGVRRCEPVRALSSKISQKIWV